MKLVIAGSRTLTVSPDFIHGALSTFGILNECREIVSGGARGIDRCGEEFHKWWMSFNKDPIAMISSFKSKEKTLRVFEADWETHGKAAGPIRNKQMADYADALLLIWDGESRGSANMKKQMLDLNKPVYEVILKRTNGGDKTLLLEEK